MCIDYMKLNAATRKDHFPLLFIDEILERIANHQYYCFLYGYSGFFHIIVDPDDQEKTTFTCPYGTFAYRRMPFRLCNALATFQRFSSAGIEVDWAKIEVMTVLPAPTNMKDIRNCLGNALFCRRFIKDFSKIARPLTTLLCKEVKFDFTLDYLNAFKEIKSAVVTLEFTFRTNMHHTRFRIRRSTWTEKEKKLHVVYYASRTLDDAQINCATTEKELLTVVFSFKNFYHHLVEFDIEIKDKRGVENRFADHRTRNRNEDEVPIDDFLPTKNVYDI
ncbi:hypothetical protein N665_0434s0004 [Sinapis alba]|nr:hypothetical protein N665_0434s0004 [Sinapis alba]